MNTLVHRIFKTVIPITIGSIILVGSFWIADRLHPKMDICEVSRPASTFLIAMVFIAAIGILYQLTIANLLRRKIQAGEIMGFLIEVTAFVVCFTALLICDELIRGVDSIELGDMMLGGLILGGVYSVSMLLFSKLIK